MVARLRLIIFEANPLTAAFGDVSSYNLINLHVH